MKCLLEAGKTYLSKYRFLTKLQLVLMPYNSSFQVKINLLQIQFTKVHGGFFSQLDLK